MPADAPTPRLEPKLSGFDTAMVVVSLVIGIGIFRTPALVAGATGGAGPFLAAWAVGGAISLIGALVFAEIGSRYPRAGGFYKVVAHCWHPLAAFVLNWAQVLMQGAGAAGVAVIGSEYLLRLVRGSSQGPEATWLAAVMMGVLLALNAAGIRTGARTQNLLSLAKIVLIAGLAVAGLLLARSGAAPVVAAHIGASPAGAAAPAASSFGGWLAALVAVFYTYGGYQNTMNLAADVREPRRGLPRAVCAGMLIVIALYLSINLAYVRALGADGVAASPLVAADLARRVLGGAGEAFVSIAIFLSAAGFVNATMLHLPRSYLAMAEDRLLPAVLGRFDRGTQAQGPGLAFFGLTAFVPLLFLGSFERLLGFVMFTDALSLAVVASCLFVLRRRESGSREEAFFRMPGYPWLPLLFILAVLGVAAQIAVRQTPTAIAGCATAAVGVPLYFALRRALA
jgi:APA family basic amino acid/polyamine antiporter